MRKDEEIRAHMRDIEAERLDGATGPLYVACANTALRFVDEDDGAYSVVSFCEFRQPLAETDAKAAAQVVAQMNAEGAVCPVCGKKAKYVICTEDDFEDRRKFCTRDPQKLRR